MSQIWKSHPLRSHPHLVSQPTLCIMPASFLDYDSPTFWPIYHTHPLVTKDSNGLPPICLACPNPMGDICIDVHTALKHWSQISEILHLEWLATEELLPSLSLFPHWNVIRAYSFLSQLSTSWSLELGEDVPAGYPSLHVTAIWALSLANMHLGTCSSVWLSLKMRNGLRV